MGTFTKIQIEKLNKFISRNYKIWRSKYSNIEGVHVGYKEKGGQATEEICIVVHVNRKKKKIDPKEKVPPFFRVKLSEGKFTKVFTDVISTGKTELHFGCGTKVCHSNSTKEVGTIGTFVKKDNGNCYVLSNMHVLGAPIIQTRWAAYNLPPTVMNISLPTSGGLRPVAYLESGCINSVLDAAIAKVDAAYMPYVSTELNGGPQSTIPLSSFSTPLPIEILISRSPYIEAAVIDQTRVIKTFTYPLGDKSFTSLLRITPKVTIGGDSGSVIYEPNSKRVAGIVVGADKHYTYGIPIAEILNFFQVSLM